MVDIQSKRTPPPVAERVPVVRWVRDNFFSSAWNTLLTILIVLILFKALPSFFEWGVLNAVWGAQDHTSCRSEGAGACWAVIAEKHRPMLFGLFPYSEHWRLIVALIIFVSVICITLSRRFWRLKILAPLWIANLGICSLLICGYPTMGRAAANNGIIYRNSCVRHANCCVISTRTSISYARN